MHVQDSSQQLAERIWKSAIQEKSTTEQLKGIFAVRKSHLDILVDDMFKDKHLRPAKKIHKESKEKVNIQRRKNRNPQDFPKRQIFFWNSGESICERSGTRKEMYDIYKQALMTPKRAGDLILSTKKNHGHNTAYGHHGSIDH